MTFRAAVFPALAGLALLLRTGSPAAAQQTNNTGLHAVPPPGNVVIDGKLDDWDLSGQTAVFANLRTRNSYSATVAAMYDADHLYLAIAWRDPTPMFNMVDARYDIGSGWKSDCLQLRIRTDMTLHVDCWYSTAAARPVINIAYGRWSAGRDKAEDADLFEAVPDAIAVGAKQAFAPGADGKSYTQEIALPWTLITGQNAKIKATGQPYKPARTYAAGDTFSLGMEFLWGPPDGKTFPIHRYADFLREGTSSREFFWTAENAWGPVTLEARGNLSLPPPAEMGDASGYLQKTDGPVALTYTMPADGFVTLVVEDVNGTRVRNLIGMAPRGKGEQTDYWDGADEAGRLMPPGAYRWRGLLHQGIDAAYEASYGTPGTPPWDTADGTGAWLSDHNPPVAVAAGNNLMVLAASGSEAGWALIGVDLDGRKKWGERRFQGIRALAVQDGHLYTGMNMWGTPTPPPTVGRLELANGAYAPFATTPEPQLMVPVALPEEKAVLRGIAVHGDTLAVSLAGVDEVRLFDKQTMKPLGTHAVPDPRGICYRADGTLLVLSGKGVIGLAGNARAEVLANGLADPVGITVDAAGTLFISDRGTQQVRVFGADGRFVRALGREGGRPHPGTWVPDALYQPAGLAVDGRGRLWVAEEDMWPKRISVWNPDGTFARDFIGPTTYGGMGACADPADKTRVFGNGCEFRLDYEKNQAAVVATVLPDNLVGDLVKHDGREYFMGKRGTLHVRRGDALVPVARFGSLRPEDVAGSGVPVTVPPGTKGGFSYLWSDTDGDGRMQAGEVRGGFPFPLTLGYWGGCWLDETFALCVCDGGYGRQTVTRIPCTGFTPAGAPLWDTDQAHTLAEFASPGPNKLFLAAGGHVIVGSPMVGLRTDGSVAWTYKDNWPDVHGSHNAPIPERDDLLVGTLSCIGQADTGTPLGRVFALNSNMGRLYVMTTDGLLVATVFQDCRIGSEPWPATATRGAPLGGVSMGGEWFGGYFFKATATAEYYLIAGGTSYNLIRLNGFDSLRPLPGGTIELTGKDLLAADALQRQQAAKAAAAMTLTISRVAAPLTVDGKLDKYPKDRWVQWTSGPYRARANLVVDERHLYLACEVWGDTTPLVNGGKDFTHLFVTGDSVDLQLGTDAAADARRTEPVPGDLRLLISVLDGEPVAVLYRWQTDGEKAPVTFRSPWRALEVASVTRLDGAQIDIRRRADAYTVEAAVPLAALGFAPQPGKSYALDLGVVFSDPTGTNRAARAYWANRATGLVNDVPGEIMATPNLWGKATVAE
jgi:hypothetical protein